MLNLGDCNEQEEMDAMTFEDDKPIGTVMLKKRLHRKAKTNRTRT
jgi:hypothetical protein